MGRASDRPLLSDAARMVTSHGLRLQSTDSTVNTEYLPSKVYSRRSKSSRKL